MLLATALVGTALGILLLASAWKRGWFGAKANERVFDLGNGVRMTLCWCTPGKFLMGSPATEEGRQEDEVQHEVTLTRGFWMAKTETTQAQWEALMPHNPSLFKGGNFPVGSVAWEQARAFTAVLTESLRQQGKLDPGWEFRLPTEAQWEYACRAGTSTAYYTGDGEAALQEAGWYGGNYGRQPSKLRAWLRRLPIIGDQIRPASRGGSGSQAIGRKEENAFGLRDMHGNAWEWCADWYGPYPGSKVTDPGGPQSGGSRVFRGGSWDDNAVDCRSARRGAILSAYEILPIGWIDTGFRVCLVPGPAAEPQPQE